LINLKPLGDGRSQTTEGVMNQLRLATARVPGISVFLRPVRDIGGPGGGNSKTLYSYNLKGDNYAELEAWTPKLAAAMRKSKIFTDVSTSLDGSGLRETLISTAIPPRASASASAPSTARCTMPSASARSAPSTPT
ncbi:multidrug efflux system subunit MdtC, partial [mine drainage metagenome]